METFGVIILAAGASTRLGEPKQLLQYNGRSLIKHATETALQVIASPVVVVLGAQSQILSNELADLPVLVVENKKWENGMASSIHTGLSTIKGLNCIVDNIILMVCDQPFVSASLLRELIASRQKESTGVVACKYSDTLGIPVLFNKKYYDELLKLEGAEGAKKLLNKYAVDVSTVSFPLGFIDIDTAHDYEKLLKDSFERPQENV